MRSRALVSLAVALALAVAAACSDGGTDAAPGTTGRASSATTAARVPPPAAARAGVAPEVRRHADDWPLPGRDHANSRATTDSPIRAANVDRLAVAWEAATPGSGVFGNLATTPLILGDTVYVQDLTSAVHAFDRATGEERWSSGGGGIVIGPNGVAVGWGRVYAIDGTSGVVAYDARTGEEVWRRRLSATETDGIDIQPTVYGGRVLVSTVPISLRGQYTGGDRGVVHALDARTGEDVWTFDTVASPDLWGDPERNSGGGAWYPPAVDPETGTVYWGVANPAPFPGLPEFPNGGSRPGRNLYTDSVVALDVADGTLRWYAQAIPHDLFDRDLVHTLLVETERGRVVVGTGKLGRVIGHDPATGEVLWDTPVGIHRNDDRTALAGPTEIWPGTFGGVLTPPAAADGTVYAATVNAPTTLAPDRTGYIGGDLGTGPGQVVAVDAATGDVVWDTEIDGDPLGAVTVVNDLAFAGTFQGRLYALDRATGEVVWEWEAPGGINGWPAAAGNLLVVPVGMAVPPRLVALHVPGAG